MKDTAGFASDQIFHPTSRSSGDEFALRLPTPPRSTAYSLLLRFPILNIRRPFQPDTVTLGAVDLARLLPALGGHDAGGGLCPLGRGRGAAERLAGLDARRVVLDLSALRRRQLMDTIGPIDQSAPSGSPSDPWQMLSGPMRFPNGFYNLTGTISFEITNYNPNDSERQRRRRVRSRSAR